MFFLFKSRAKRDNSQIELPLLHSIKQELLNGHIQDTILR